MIRPDADLPSATPAPCHPTHATENRSAKLRCGVAARGPVRNGRTATRRLFLARAATTGPQEGATRGDRFANLIVERFTGALALRQHARSETTCRTVRTDFGLQDHREERIFDHPPLLRAGSGGRALRPLWTARLDRADAGPASCFRNVRERQFSLRSPRAVAGQDAGSFDTPSPAADQRDDRAEPKTRPTERPLRLTSPDATAGDAG